MAEVVAEVATIVVGLESAGTHAAADPEGHDARGPRRVPDCPFCTGEHPQAGSVVVSPSDRAGLVAGLRRGSIADRACPGRQPGSAGSSSRPRATGPLIDRA